MIISSLRVVAASALALTAATSHAQQPAPAALSQHRPALFRAGAGQCWLGTGDYLVPKVSVEYAPQFGQHFRLGTRLAYLSRFQPYAFGWGHTIPQAYRALNLEQEAYWLPFGVNKTVEFSVGAGVFGGYARQDGFHLAYLTDQGFRYEADNVRGFHAGYIASLSLDVALNPARTWRVGGRLALQNDTRANILPGGQFQLSRAW